MRIVGFTILLAAFAAAFPTVSWSQNLVLNPGFETNGGGIQTNDASPWSVAGGALIDNEAQFAHQGSSSGWVAYENCGCINGGTENGSISQTITIPKNAIYELSFFSAVAASPATYQLTASIGGQVVVNTSVSGAYKQYTADATLNAGANNLVFAATLTTSAGPDALTIDDVSLTFLSDLPVTPPPPPPVTPPPPVNPYPAVDLRNAAQTLNQLSVADTIFIASNNNSGPVADTLRLVNIAAAPIALSQIDGEGNTGAEHTAFQLETEFLNAMLDPFVEGRGGEGANASGGSAQPLGYTSEQQFMPRAMADAYGMVLKGPAPAVYVPHWSTWGGAYGGVSNTDGNAATGSNRLKADTFGFAAGMDYHVSRDTMIGFALGGGGTNWNLATLSGSGHSTALQAGVYGITHSGPFYEAADFGFTNNWFDTNRTAIGDQLQANFGGQSYGGRLEGGYHLNNLPFGVTPYAAVQAQEFVTPSYSENDITGGGFGLSYNAMSATDVRTEIGSRFEELTSLDNMPLVLRGKLAWAHDFVDNPSLSAAFVSLPGTSFIVNGAPIPHNSALVSGGAELFLAPHWSVSAKFDGEFASNSQTYGGTGTLRYTW